MKLYKLKKLIYSKYVLVLIIACSFGHLRAQSDNSSTFKFDIHAGLAGTQVQGDGLGGFDKLGFMGGLGIRTELAEKFDLGFEINFVQKGSVKRANPEAGDYSEYKMSLGYIQVPVYLKYNVTDKIAFTGGPAIGVLIGSKEEDMNGEIPVQTEFEPFELAVIIGVRYAISEALSTGIRLDQSLLPIRTKGDFTYNRLIGKQYNTALGIYLYYSIR